MGKFQNSIKFCQYFSHFTKIEKYYFWLIFEPTCAHALWALRRRLLSVCLSVCPSVCPSVRENTRKKVTRKKFISQVKVKGQGQRSRSLLMEKKRQVGSRQRQVALFFIVFNSMGDLSLFTYGIEIFADKREEHYFKQPYTAHLHWIHASLIVDLGRYFSHQTDVEAY